MSHSSFRVRILPGDALRYRSELLALTLQASRAARIQAATNQIDALAHRAAYEDHVRFLAQLPVSPTQLDQDLIAVAVFHVNACISRSSRWDHGKHIVATFAGRRDQAIAAISLSEKYAWAAEERYHGRQNGKAVLKGMFEQTLPARANWYLDQIIRHVTGN